MTAYGFVIDNRRCIGCHACSTACKSENEVPLGVHRTWIKTAETGLYPDVTRTFQVTRCNHCVDAPCSTICPTSAMHRRDDGIVDFDKDSCIGCKACMQACPYDAIYIDPETHTAAKCNFCAHRVTIGLEPACVVVCPEHAIVAGDLHDPRSEISRLLAAEPTTVRRPDKGTSPRVFYIDGDQVNLDPTPADAPPSVPYAVERRHERPWRWPVPAYMVTKAIATGTVAVASLLSFSGFTPDFGIAGATVALLALLATTALLVGDLEHPKRFFYILTRPNWDSWLTRGAVVLTAFGAVVAAWLAVEVLAQRQGEVGLLRVGLLAVGTPAALLGAVYTAFLFGQARGRDAWQSPWIAPHLAIQALMAGAAALLIVSAVVPVPSATWMLLVGTFTAAAAFDVLLRGLEKSLWTPAFRGQLQASIALTVAPAIAVPFARHLPAVEITAAVAALVGLYLYEHAVVMAPQDVPNA